MLVDRAGQHVGIADVQIEMAAGLCRGAADIDVTIGGNGEIAAGGDVCRNQPLGFCAEVSAFPSICL